MNLRLCGPRSIGRTSMLLRSNRCGTDTGEEVGGEATGGTGAGEAATGDTVAGEEATARTGIMDMAAGSTAPTVMAMVTGTATLVMGTPIRTGTGTRTGTAIRATGTVD